MRAKAYVRVLAAATILTLVGAALAPDILAPFLTYSGESAAAREMEARVFHAIAWPPQVAARAVGIWIDSNSAQLWPRGWPIFAAFALRLALISIPFWFLVGIVVFELGYALLRQLRSHRTSPAR